MLRRPISMQPSSPASVSQILHLPMDSFIHHPSHPYSPVLTPSETKGRRSHSTPAGTFDLIDYHAYAAKQLPSEALRTDVASSLLLGGYVDRSDRYLALVPVSHLIHSISHPQT